MKKILILAAFITSSFLGIAQNATAQYGYTNIDFIITQDPAYDNIQKNLATLQQKWQARIEEVQQRIRTNITAYEQSRNSADQATLREIESDIIQLQEQYREMQAKAAQEIQEENERLMQPLYEKTEKAVQEVAKELGLSAVYNAGSLLYANEQEYIDITPYIYEKLGIKKE